MMDPLIMSKAKCITSLKTLFPLVGMALFLANCDTVKPAQTTGASSEVSGTAAKRWNMPEIGTVNTYGSDTLILRQSSYIPIEGRTFAVSDLEGTWELESINGKWLTGKSNLKPEVIAKAVHDAARAKQGSETVVDTTRTKDGLKTTTSTIVLEHESSIKITPPQGGNYHMPEKPSLRFYGLNETFSGFTGCNRISGRYSTSDTSGISFNNATASTRMVCMGDYDEDSFVKAINRVNNYKVTKNQLQLLDGNDVVLIFARLD